MSNWIDYNMLMAEIALHRSNAQLYIKNYKDSNKPFPTSPDGYTTSGFIDRLLYENEVGKEMALMCLQQWCEDFKFSANDVAYLDLFGVASQKISPLPDSIVSQQAKDSNSQLLQKLYKTNIMVQKYQKKPVVVEAIQFDGLNLAEIKDFVGDKCEIKYVGAPLTAQIIIHTLEGDMNVSLYDYVIKGVKGEFYPCKPDIFLDTYEIQE